MLVRARDKIFRVKDLKGKKIGITKSLNTIKNDWWRIQEHMGIENILMLNDMTMDDIELVEFPYADDWYDKPEMLAPPMNNPSELWMRVTTSTTMPSAHWRRHCWQAPSMPSTPRARSSSTLSGGDRLNQGDDLRPVQATRTGRFRLPTPPPSSPAPM